MYIIEQGDIAKVNSPLIKMFFHPTLDAINQATRYELWGSSFKDEGDDFTELRLIDHKDQVIWKQRVGGY